MAICIHVYIMQAMLDQFNDMKMYGGNVHLNMTDNVSIKISDTSDGWNWHQNEVRMLM